MKKYDYIPTAADYHVLAQLGAKYNNDGDTLTIDDDTASTLADVCKGGASAGFHGFIYHSEIRDFLKGEGTRAAIIADVKTEIEAGLFEDCGGVVSTVMRYNCLKGYGEELEENVARALFGNLDDGDPLIWSALAWGALEHLAYALDGNEIEE